MAKSQTFTYNAAMLIDDNEIDNLINQKMIESCSLSRTVLVHTGARSALEFLKNIQKLSTEGNVLIPELIFLDIDMPIMDGFQFMDEFSKLPDAIKKKTKVVMLTSSLSPHDVTKAKKNSHIVKFLNKPLSLEELEKLREV
jgi:CheY-like chemotaxis protein